MRARVIGIGQRAAGDDGVGLAVLSALRERAVPSGVELLEVADPTALVELLNARVPIILVDAVLGSPEGEVVERLPEELAERPSLRLSSHGLGLLEAIELARTLGGGQISSPIRIVGITIARPECYRQGLSPEVAAAVTRAAQRVLSLVEVCRA